jgi:hypothetical protein
MIRLSRIWVFAGISRQTSRKYPCCRNGESWKGRKRGDWLTRRSGSLKSTGSRWKIFVYFASFVLADLWDDDIFQCSFVFEGTLQQYTVNYGGVKRNNRIGTYPNSRPNRAIIQRYFVCPNIQTKLTFREGVHSWKGNWLISAISTIKITKYNSI